MAFCFVDRVLEIEAGKRARGQFLAPPDLLRLPPCLVAEAVGQLASWVAMSATDFRRRPVAGIASEINILSTPVGGMLIDLGVEIGSFGADAIVYDGWAASMGKEIIDLKHCVGPMLPMEDFDDAANAKKHFEEICGKGSLKRFTSSTVPDFPIKILERRGDGKRIWAELQVPASAPFFADHFPRKPVLPASLLLDQKIKVGFLLSTKAGLLEPTRPFSVRLETTIPMRVRNMKVRAFTPPGSVLEIDAEVLSANGTLELAIKARSAQKTISSGRLQLALGQLALGMGQ